MSDPLALVPLAAAARSGRVDAHRARDLVAAGITLLQRSAPLVRALDGHRAAIVLPTSPAFLVALAASDGRAAALIDPLAAPAEVARQLAEANVGAAFTITALQDKLPAGFPRVLLDAAPLRAYTIFGDNARDVDLGSHAGLALEGEMDAPGREEEAVVVYTPAMTRAVLTHRDLLARARAIAGSAELGPNSVSLALLPFAEPFGLTATLMAPLLAGGRVITMPRFDPERALDVIRTENVTFLAGSPPVFADLLAALEGGGGSLRANELSVCICSGSPLAPALRQRWERATGVVLAQG